MTALAFIFVLFAAYINWLLIGVFVPGTHITIYVAAFVIVLATASVAGLVNGNIRNRLGVFVLIANFVASHYAWQYSNAVELCAIKDAMTAGWFILAGTTRWELATGGWFFLSLLTGILTGYGVIDDLSHRHPVYIDLSNHADLTSIFGHLGSITLGAGSGDAGKLVRLALGTPALARPLGYSLLLGLRRLAEMAVGRTEGAD